MEPENSVELAGAIRQLAANPDLGRSLGRTMTRRNLLEGSEPSVSWVRSKGTPQLTLEAFLLAFSRFDLDAMLDCFHADATAYFPAEHHQPRLQGIEAIGKAFAAVIERLKAAGKTSLTLDAEDVAVEEWGDAACVTFHLRGQHLSRRTLVVRRRAARWRIVHLHASNASLAE